MFTSEQGKIQEQTWREPGGPTQWEPSQIPSPATYGLRQTLPKSDGGKMKKLMKSFIRILNRKCYGKLKYIDLCPC